MFTCITCGRETYLIRGKCDQCAPELHERHNANLAFIREMSEAFKAETGKDSDSLSDWYEFERFMERYQHDKRMAILAQSAREYEALKHGAA